MIRILYDWDTEPAGPRRRQAAPLDLREVRVAAVKDEGFKTADGGWLNWSKFREPSAFLMPRVGDVVRVGLDKSGYIRQLAIVGPNGEAQRPAIAGGAPSVQLAPTTIAALAATRKPEPPAFGEGDPDWLRPTVPAPAERVVLAGGLETDDRGRAIARMNALTTATAILSSGGGATTAEEVFELGERIEAWLFR